MSLRLTFAESCKDIDKTLASYQSQLVTQQISLRQVFVYSTRTADIDSAIENRLVVGLTSAGFQVIQFSSINSILNDLLNNKPSGAIINIDEFDELTLIASMINTEAWKTVTRNTAVIVSSARAGNPTFRSVWQNLVQAVVLQSPPDVVESIAIFNRSKDLANAIRFNVSLEDHFKRVQLATDSFTRFSVTTPEPVNYIVNLTVQGIPPLSTSVPLPLSGTPPFEGVLKTNIGVATVLGEHVISLVGQGGGFTDSDLITYKTN